MRILYKIGGSLLDEERLPQLLAKYLTNEARNYSQQNLKYEPLLITGGGATADVVREWHNVFKLTEEQSHWLALKSLDFNVELLHQIFINAQPVEGSQELADLWERGLLPLIKPYKFVREFESLSPVKLPHNWDVTTDTIGLWLASELNANRYVLLKSCDLEPQLMFEETNTINTCSLKNMSEMGLVDRYFNTMYESLAKAPIIQWLNLRR